MPHQRYFILNVLSYLYVPLNLTSLKKIRRKNTTNPMARPEGAMSA